MMGQPIDTSTLGPIRIDPMASPRWASPAEAAKDLRLWAIHPKQQGKKVQIRPEHVLEIAAMLERAI